MTTITTLEQLATKINGKLWIKGDMKRIYVDAGHNTKKMSTKTYIYQREDGTFGVSCYIDCPSQPMAWIKSQQQEVIQGVENDIEQAMLIASLQLHKHKITTENGADVMVYVSEGNAEPAWMTESVFFDKYNDWPSNIFPEVPKHVFEK